MRIPEVSATTIGVLERLDDHLRPLEVRVRQLQEAVQDPQDERH